jgi:predicted metal-dependent hydrolase
VQHMKDRPEQKTALILGRPVRYTVRRSRRARRMHLHVSPRAGLEVVLPQRWPMRDVEQAIDEHAAWVDKQVTRLDVRDGPVVREITTGSGILVFGRERRVEIQPPTGMRAKVSLADETLRVSLTPEDRMDPRPVIQRWLRREAGRHIRERVEILADLHGFRPNRVIVGERTSRWGSCSSRGNLSFCYRLLMAPEAVIDAVVLHELCHLKHLNHGVRFKALLKRVCPEHDELMDWLKTHQAELEI